MANRSSTIKIFKYISELDAFTITDEYYQIAETLGLIEWSPVVWIGRLFCLGNDYGEHWFDNWDLREKIDEKATAIGLDANELLIIDPDRFQNGKDGPCHTHDMRKSFWTDVLKSLELSYETIYQEAIDANKERKTYWPEEYITDLKERFEKLLQADDKDHQ